MVSLVHFSYREPSLWAFLCFLNYKIIIYPYFVLIFLVLVFVFAVLITEAEFYAY